MHKRNQDKPLTTDEAQILVDKYAGDLKIQSPRVVVRGNTPEDTVCAYHAYDNKIVVRPEALSESLARLEFAFAKEVGLAAYRKKLMCIDAIPVLLMVLVCAVAFVNPLVVITTFVTLGICAIAGRWAAARSAASFAERVTGVPAH